MHIETKLRRRVREVERIHRHNHEGNRSASVIKAIEDIRVSGVEILALSVEQQKRGADHNGGSASNHVSSSSASKKPKLSLSEEHAGGKDAGPREEQENRPVVQEDANNSFLGGSTALEMSQSGLSMEHVETLERQNKSMEDACGPDTLTLNNFGP
ncbi:hypothetical protein FGG08_004494 [Glutinoglossum americanum]|uniref:Uncharacterized protein n=1 Tax=Glutinoglossum americanum TaxID=1670608 RepID=A0A9P8L3Y0_9PEZI|nr:hypothetical protein FGG08_004494 [Glutinoglossum americanum]